MSEPALRVEDLHKTFRRPGSGPVHAVAGIDLTVERGEVVAVLGPNGAGKTTTLDMVLGLTEPTSGTVRVLGTPPRQAVAEGRISAVLQTGGLLRDLTVRETVQMIASTFATPADVDAVLDRAGLAALARQRVSKCSGGEQQRLRFALALVPDPDLLVLDEPTAGMDVTARREFWATMHAEADRGRTVLFATHYLTEADDFAERIVVVDRGRIVADGTTSEIRRHAADRTVSAVLPGDVGDLPGAVDVRRDGDRVLVRATDSDAVAAALLARGGHDLLIAEADLEDAFVALTEPGEVVA
ncbi:ABC transporter ATP-binding protein [Nocardioides panacisoli]|uniref:ABC transporter ATP-binding protein n=1 Tax=Nocardioides panacisoli TaxID=627624 RepID=UPI001C625281|nr:ABC transporter ATP-binding protein [Nocardioides panacisoli]QYJ02784.1 ABC transporter ATP-binding protein [Nocardioides panacisoli]